ncbi:MAG TPA: hypothetical protein VKT52_12910, partial [Ktedonobacterales bacterium]|nr:hypothetical protein [Ktedonobacterales bacterium]
MATTSKGGAQKSGAADRDSLKQDEQEPTVQLMSAGARDTQPVDAIPSEMDRDTDDQLSSGEDEAATVLRQSVRPETPSRSRKNTLAMAITRPARQDERAAQATPPLGVESQRVPSSDAFAPEKSPAPPTASITDEGDEDDYEEGDEADDEIADEVDEWTVADQPTVYLSPRSRPISRPSSRPAYLDTGEGQTWPPRPPRAQPPTERPRGPSRARPDERAPQAPMQPQPATPPPAGGSPRLASPTGRALPGTPPAGVPRAALPNPRMQRFQELRGQLEESDGHERLRQESRPVAEVVRQWWHDLRPGLEGALDYQREARASGVHPIPAHVHTTTSRLGDAFGRLTASARDLTERAQAAAAPALKRLHAQAEQVTQALVDKIEGSPARQQFPLLGPGRVAVFFKQGVTVG